MQLPMARSMMAKRRRRWTNSNPTMGHCLVYAVCFILCQQTFKLLVFLICICLAENTKGPQDLCTLRIGLIHRSNILLVQFVCLHVFFSHLISCPADMTATCNLDYYFFLYLSNQWLITTKYSFNAFIKRFQNDCIRGWCFSGCEKGWAVKVVFIII